MKIQPHLVNNLVMTALERSRDLSFSDATTAKYSDLITKIQNGDDDIELSADEAETLLLSILTDMESYVSVRVKRYYLKKKGKGRRRVSLVG